jgi:hypothetical protein
MLVNLDHSVRRTRAEKEDEAKLSVGFFRAAIQEKPGENYHHSGTQVKYTYLLLVLTPIRSEL